MAIATEPTADFLRGDAYNQCHHARLTWSQVGSKLV